MNGKNIYKHQGILLKKISSSILGPRMVLCLSIISLTVLQSIGIIDFLKMFIFQFEINFLSIVFLSQPVLQHSISQWLVIFHMNTVGNNRIGLVDTNCKVTQIPEILYEIIPNLSRPTTQLDHIIILLVQCLPQLFIPLFHERYRSGFNVYRNNLIVRRATSIHLLHVFLEVFLCHLSQLVLLYFLLL